MDIDERTFEQSVAELAVNTLKSKVPALMDYALAFQLVDRGEDDTRAIGFFGFRVGKTLLYVPIFFLSGEVKGTELCYVVEEDRFVPLTEEWVNQLIKKKTFTIGEEAGKNRKRQGISGPDLRRLRVPPMEAKISGDRSVLNIKVSSELPKNGEFDEVTLGGLLMFEKAAVEIKADVPRLPEIVAKHGITEAFLKNAQENPSLANAVFTFFKPEDFLVAMESHMKPAADKAAVTARNYSSDEKVRVFSADDAVRNPADLGFLSADEKKRVLKGEIVVKDHRGDNEKREVFEADLTKRLSNPSEGGVYDVLTEDGGIARMAILQPKVVGSGGSRDIRLLVTKDGEFRFAFKAGIWCTGRLERKESRDAISEFGEALSSKDSWSKEKKDDGVPIAVGDMENSYVLVNAEGSYAIGPFEVQTAVENADGTKTLFVRQSTPTIHGREDRVGTSISKDRMGLPFDGVLFSDDGVVNLSEGGRENNHAGTNNNFHGAQNYPTGSWESLRKIVITDKPIRNPVFSNGVVMVPKNGDFRVLKLSREMSGPSAPGTQADIYLGIGKFADALDVLYDGTLTRVIVGDKVIPASTTKRAYEILCREIGVGADDAKTMLKSAQENPQQRQRYIVGHVKTAEPFDHPDFDAHHEPLYDAPVQQGGISMMQLLQDKGSFDPGSSQVYRHFKDENNYQAVYDKDIKNLNKATGTGQEDVFNAAAISALANVSDVSAEIEEYLPAMMKALDKLGRTLFLFYWHGEDIQERYGKTEAKSLEDDISNLFENLGDAIIRLKKNAPNLDDLFGSGIIGGSGAGQTT
jgi:hypothetical protein